MKQYHKQIVPEQKTKKSFGLRHLCLVYKILTGILKPLISGQNVNSHLVRESVHLTVATSRLNKVMHVEN